MMRTKWAFLAGILLLIPIAGKADDKDTGEDKAPAGTWKLSVMAQGQHVTLWLLDLQSKDDKWTGKVLASAERAPQATVALVSVTPDESSRTLKQVNITLKGAGQRFGFEGKFQEGAKTILGSIVLGRQTFPAELEPTQLKSLDPYELSKEVLAQKKEGPEVVEAASILLSDAAEKKATPEDVHGWTEKALKSAQPFGRRYEREIALRIAGLLSVQEGFADVAVESAQRAEKLVSAKDLPNLRKRVLETLAAALKKAGKEDEAKAIEAKSEKIPWVQAEPFSGRKGKSDRVVLVELFTGAECPPCVAADLAFDTLGKTYTPKEGTFLEYHLHIPGPDPLTNPDSEARAKYYREYIEGTPTILFDGRPEAGGGGGNYEAQDKYNEYLAVVDTLVNKPSRAKVTATAVRKGDKIDITAEASEVEKPGDKIRLRIALVEDQVDYTGGNKVPTEHHVVRALPGGADGLALKDKTGKQTASVDLAALRKELGKYLDEYAAKELPFPHKDRPMEMKNLSVVAFVQNDATKEVLQAVQVDVQAEKSAE